MHWDSKHLPPSTWGVASNQNRSHSALWESRQLYHKSIKWFLQFEKYTVLCVLTSQAFASSGFQRKWRVRAWSYHMEVLKWSFLETLHVEELMGKYLSLQIGLQATGKGKGSDISWALTKCQALCQKLFIVSCFDDILNLNIGWTWPVQLVPRGSGHFILIWKDMTSFPNLPPASVKVSRGQN